MINAIQGFFVATFTFNSLIGFFIYWMPMLLCLSGYTIRTARYVARDTKNRSKQNPATGGVYHPTDTLGDVIGRYLISILPIANIWACIFDVFPELFEGLFSWIVKIFNTPLIKDSKRYKEMRESNTKQTMEKPDDAEYNN
jgi:hypothetical protein